MKSTIKRLSFFSLLISFLAFFACSKETNESQFDFEQFKSEISTDQNYQDFLSAKATLLTQVKSPEVDLIGIISMLQEKKIEDYCSFDFSLIAHFDGSQNFIDNYCSMRSNFKELTSNNEGFGNLSSAQFSEILNIATPQIENGVSLRADCLLEFQVNVDTAFDSCSSIPTFVPMYNNCIDNGLNAAVFFYDGCCSTPGQSGCP